MRRKIDFKIAISCFWLDYVIQPKSQRLMTQSDVDRAIAADRANQNRHNAIDDEGKLRDSLSIPSSWTDSMK